MIQKLIGLTLCALAVVLAWWFFSPRTTEVQQNTPDPALAIQVRPLLVTSAVTEEENQLAPVTPKSNADAERIEKSNETPTTLTPLTNEEIENELSKYQRQFQNCWVQRLRDIPQLKGRVVFRLTLTPRGRVGEVQLSQSDVEDVLMLQCLTSTLNRIEFREFKGDPIEILFPLEFSR